VPADDTPVSRVSVSLEVLRTEIRAANGELELRLRDYIDTKVLGIKSAQDSFARGDFTRAQEAALEDVVDARLDKRASAGLTRRQWKIAIAGVCISLLSMATAVTVAINTLLHARP